MRITLRNQMKYGDKKVPAGEYWVSISEEGGGINLAGQGRDYKVPATRRPTKKNIRSSQVTFYASGGPTWSLVISVPPKFEWVAFLITDNDLK